jgi:HEAT repeat protein
MIPAKFASSYMSLTIPVHDLPAEIASHAKASAPCLVELYGSDLGVLRGNAAAVLVRALANRQDVDAATATQAGQVVLRALRDPKEGVRSETVIALGKFGEHDLLPALRQVAETDPGPEVQGHSVRKQAAKAIAAIENRAGQDPRR